MKTNEKHEFQVTCPNCSTKFSLTDSVISKFEKSIRKDFQSEIKQKENELRLKLKEELEMQNHLKVLERENVINQLKEQLDIAKRKAEQFSMQGQGEVFEKHIEDILKTNFQTDEIIEVKKGQLGADCIQIVKSPTGVELGQILWECKNTQSFSNGWIDKLKSDNLKAKAQVMVIVTTTMPKDVKGKFAIKDNVWICTPDSIIELSLGLRYAFLKIQEVLIKQNSIQSKQELLYQYLTSNEFAALFESILSGLQKLQESFDEEKKKITHLWGVRQKHFELLLSNAVGYYANIRGVTSGEAPEIKMLETHPQAD